MPHLRQGSLLLAVLAGLLVPSTAAAVDFWCVDQTGTVSDFSSCDASGACVGSTAHASIAEALLSFADDPLAGDHICVATPGVHVETVTVDDSIGQLGALPHIRFLDPIAPNFCPATPDVPAFTVLGDPGALPPDELGLQNLHWAGCATTAQLAEVSRATFGLGVSRVVGAAGPLITLDDASGEEWVAFGQTRIEGVDGVVYRGGATLLVDAGSEISGCVAPPGEPLLEVVGVPTLVIQGGPLMVGGSFITGNVTDGAPLLQGPKLWAIRSVISDNVVLNDAPLIALEHPGLATSFTTVELTVFSNNRLLGAGTAPTPTIIPRPMLPPAADDYCLPAGSDQVPLHGRAPPAVSAAPSDAALIQIHGDGLPAGGFVNILENFIVENELGPDGALIRATGELPDLQVDLVHNTVSDQGTLLDGTTSGPDARFVSARNLYLGTPEVDLSAGFSQAEVTLDLVQGDPLAWQGEFAGLAGIVGPAPPDIDWIDAFIDPATVDAWTDLDRNVAACPEHAIDSSMLVAGLGAHCGLAAARSYFPTVDTLADAAVPWPWTGPALAIEAMGEAANMPGATGWLCETQHPWDSTGPGGPGVGDGDGYTTLVDCDNGDVSVTPVLPSSDGYDGGPCSDDTCYLCPADIPAQDDDDSAGDDDDSAGDDDDSGGDDDDSAGDDDDDTAGDDDDGADDDDTAGDDDDGANDDDTAGDDDDTSDDDDGWGDLPQDCESRGCGFSYRLTTLPLLLVLPWGLSRRRRSAAR